MQPAIDDLDIQFNPKNDVVYLTGSFTGWAEPGAEGAIVMEPIVTKEGVIYTTTVTLEAGEV